MKALLFMSIDLKKRTILEQGMVKLRGVRRIIEILGQYDVAVEVEAENREKMEELIAKIGALDGIDKISTYLISKEILPYVAGAT
jgi:DNA-binding Lrp family transcriptional regulator